MKKFTQLMLSLAVVAALNNAVMADGNAFTPLDFDKTTSSSASANSTPTVDATASDAIGNENIQNAILQLDNAQVGIRNDLINYKAKYADVDAQYKLIKNERAVLKKQVRSIEKRIKSIDRSKEKLRRSMI
ncbi:hypothetical protein IJ732_06825 [bacterium]|nr:hypothetical protein [bacterium]